MAIAILVGRNDKERQSANWFCLDWKKALLSLNSSLDIRIWPNIGDPAEIDFVLVWNHPLGTLNQFVNAKAIYSLAAGVDHIFVDSNLNPLIPLVRIVDPYMANDIVQYVAAYVLHYIKRLDHWAEKQKQKIWFKEPPFTYSDQTIGIMGLGHLGGKAAHILHQLGLNTIGWSQSPKNFPGITHYTNEAEFSKFLARTNILICMLPLTPKTENILNRHTFSQLPEKAYLINVGRGKHLVEEDLLTALSSGQLSGACLDVFRTEPLPPEHPFWGHPLIQVTPHIASVTNPLTAAPQLYDNYKRAMAGLNMHHVVNTTRGY